MKPITPAMIEAGQQALIDWSRHKGLTCPTQSEAVLRKVWETMPAGELIPRSQILLAVENIGLDGLGDPGVWRSEVLEQVKAKIRALPCGTALS